MALPIDIIDRHVVTSPFKSTQFQNFRKNYGSYNHYENKLIKTINLYIYCSFLVSVIFLIPVISTQSKKNVVIFGAVKVNMNGNLNC